LLLLGSAITRRPLGRHWLLLPIAIPAIFACGLLLLNGTTLQQRLLSEAGDNGIDDGRSSLWSVAVRMIETAPWFGLGLGTFESAYPLYADRVVPFLTDQTHTHYLEITGNGGIPGKAHNDYLELAAGFGIPATSLWLGSLLWLTVLCIRGVFKRR